MVQADHASLAIYIHWPFCQSKCPYCDFNSHVRESIDQAHWRAAYAKELDHYAQIMPQRRVTSIFFGGGTPSLMETKTVETILQNITRNWALADDVEITLEANPTSAEAAKFSDFRAAGINRLSLGVQSLRDEALTFLGRAHDAVQAKRAIGWAARYFPRFSFDLIYARKDQNPDAWQQELQEALAMAGGHLSLYQLTIEPSTQFHTLAQRGEILTAPHEGAAVMYERTQDIMNAAGLPAYEVSNHAHKGEESRHNLAYWHYDDYIGVGPGAHGRYRANGQRLATEAHRAPEVWLDHTMKQGHGLRLQDKIDDEMAKREALLMGLRLVEGIDHDGWQKKFTQPLNDFLSREKRARLERENYLIDDGKRLRATPGGLQRLNALLDYFAV